jgi:hypothetical protein
MILNVIQNKIILKNKLYVHVYKDSYGLNKKITDLEFEKNVFWIYVFINFEKNWRENYTDDT